MKQLYEAVRELQAKGYDENLVPRYDHLSCRSGKVELFPSDIIFDEVERFENDSNPDDQAVLYAVSAPLKNIKGLYIDSYGLYHDELSQEMLQRMKYCRPTALHKELIN